MDAGSGSSDHREDSRVASSAQPKAASAATFSVPLSESAPATADGICVAEREERERLRESEKHLRMLIDGVRDAGLVELDAQGRIRTWNSGSQRMMGYTADEIIGRHYEMLFTPEDRANKIPAQLLRKAWENDGYQAEGWRIRKDGSRVWADVAVRALHGPGGSILGYCKITRDISERRRSEEALARANLELKDRNTELEQLVYSISHDLKSPLVTFQGFLGYARRDIESKRVDRLDGFLNTLDEAAQRMRRTIDDLLEFARIGRESVPKQWVSVEAVVDAYLAFHEQEIREKGIAVEIARPLAPVWGYPARVAQALENLLDNAFRHGCQGTGGRVEVGAQARRGDVRVFVRDHGPGVPLDQHERIFGLFQRLNRDVQGTGIGLTIVRRVATIHGGTAWVESSPGQGATFWISFPSIEHASVGGDPAGAQEAA